MAKNVLSLQNDGIMRNYSVKSAFAFGSTSNIAVM